MSAIAYKSVSHIRFPFMGVQRLCIFLFIGGLTIHAQQNIADFVSLQPGPANTDFKLPVTHVYQKIIESGDPLTQGGTLRPNNDLTAYVPIGDSSEFGYLGINSESAPGAVTILDINFNATSKLWQTTLSEAINFSGVVTTAANCSGTVTPWKTIISCEEVVISTDLNSDGYNDLGWCVEIDPSTKNVIDKLWALGNFKHENVTVHPNERTVYQGADSNPGYLYKFVADNPRDLNSGSLYVYSGSKNGAGNWILLNNTTPTERNETLLQSAAADATVFNGIEDVEVGPDGWVYFAVKNESRVYRFQDSDPITGTVVTQMETFAGNASYDIVHSNGTTNVAWGSGNDNLAFDGEGNLWVLQDGNGPQNYIWVVEKGHSQGEPKVKIFGRTPIGSEPTGITFSPDFRFLFMSVQHPDSGNSSSLQTDAAGNQEGFDKSISLVIALKENMGTLWYLDADGDGFAAETTINSFDNPGAGFTTEVLPTTDCNDADAEINPGTVWYLDADGDGYAIEPTVISCYSPGNDYTSTVLPTTDCNDADPAINSGTIWYLDADGDGYASDPSVMSCGIPGEGYTMEVLPLTDCDDTDETIHPDTIWYLDADGDGYANETTMTGCTSPGIGYTANILPVTDCDDNDASIHPYTVWYLDADGDGYADAQTMTSCTNPGTGYTTEMLPTTDCNDNYDVVHPETIWYLDADNDGYAEGDPIRSCTSPGPGYTFNVLPLEEDRPLGARTLVYPNPSNGEVFILLNTAYQEIEVAVFNTAEQLVLRNKFQQAQAMNLNFAHLSSGIYYLQLVSDGKSAGVLKVIKK